MEKLAERRALYAQGLNDTEIALRQGVTPSAVLYWRRRHGLPRSPDAHGKPRPMRRLLYNMGWWDSAVARFQGTNVQTAKGWRKRHAPNLRPSGRTGQGRKEIESLQLRVVKAIGFSLPRDIAADAAAALMLAVIEGKVALDAIEKSARAFRGAAISEYASVFGTRSLDADLPNSDGLRMIDMLVDRSSSDWLEEMGATVH